MSLNELGMACAEPASAAPAQLPPPAHARRGRGEAHGTDGPRPFAPFRKIRGAGRALRPRGGDHPAGLEPENHLDWSGHFTRYFDDGDGDIICDIDSLIRRIEEEVRGAKGESAECGLKRDGRLTHAELRRIFSAECRQKFRGLREGLRKVLCRHPLEWNADMYGSDFRNKMASRFDMGPDRFGILRSKMERLDFWNGDNGVRSVLGEAATGDCLWFAHPIYFLQHMGRAGLNG